MITVAIYEPLWRCQRGIIDQYGEGSLAPECWKDHDNIECFSVKTAGCEISVFPSKGEIRFDNALVLKTDSGRLVWKREMAVHYHTNDDNTRSSPAINFYAIGIQNTKGVFGHRVYDGTRLVLGI